MKKGMEEGRIEGALITSRDMIIELLNERFGDVSSDIFAFINETKDNTKLKIYFRYAARCKSLDEFKSLLDGNKN